MHQVAVGVLVRDGKVLMVHRSPARAWYPDVWDFPGGHIEPGESPGHALARELAEELGIGVAEPMTAPDIHIRREDEELHVWFVYDWVGEPFNRQPDEHDGLRWVVAADLDGMALFDECCRGWIMAAHASHRSM